tara:strand:+ start:172 stop:1557 length:1386 start_codon:yes stop_codon:yes gene_type:complete
MALTKIDDRGLKTPIDLLDNEKIRFGTGNDLEIFTDGNHSYLDHNGDGSFYIRTLGTSENLILQASGTTYIKSGSQTAITLEPTSQNATFAGSLTVDTNTLHVDATNNRVGIGTTSPDNILHLESASNPYLQLEKVGTSSKVYLGNSNGEAVLECAGGAIKLKPNGRSNDFVLNTSGNLGIGTASPDSKLHVSVGSGNAQLRLTRSNAAANTNKYGRLLWESSTDVLTGEISVARASAENDGDMLFYTANSGTLAERMRIDSSGNVVIKNTGVTASTGLIQLNHTDGRKNTIGTHYASNAYDSRIEFGISDGSTSGGTNRIASLSYAGISFGSDTASANRLDDYEEGTFTPTQPTVGFNSASGRYTKIGRQVTVSIFCTLPTNSSGVAFYIDSMPFTSSNLSGSYREGGYVMWTEYTSDALKVLIHDNSTRVEVYNGSGGTLQLAGLDNQNFRIQLHYTTD